MPKKLPSSPCVCARKRLCFAQRSSQRQTLTLSLFLAFKKRKARHTDKHPAYRKHSCCPLWQQVPPLFQGGFIVRRRLFAKISMLKKLPSSLYVCARKRLCFAQRPSQRQTLTPSFSSRSKKRKARLTDKHSSYRKHSRCPRWQQVPPLFQSGFIVRRRFLAKVCMLKKLPSSLYVCARKRLCFAQRSP